MNQQPQNRQRRVKRQGRTGGLGTITQNDQPARDDLAPVERLVRGAPIMSGESTEPGRRSIWHIIARNGLSAVVILALIWAFFLSGWLNLRGIELKGSTTLSQVDIEKQINTYLDANPVERNVLFTKTDAIAKMLKDSYPTVKKININRTLFLTLQISIAESKPALLWQSRGERWVVAEDGRILRPAAGEEQIEGTIFDTAQLEVKVGDRVGDAQFISFVRDIYSRAKEFGFTVQATSIEATTRELKALLDTGVAIRMDTTRDAAEQLRSAQATFDTAAKDRKTIKEYVDVRVPGRAFYK